MGYSLVIDRGNTAVKAAVYDGWQLVDMVRDDSIEGALTKIAGRWADSIDSAIYCSVGADAGREMQILRGLVRNVIEMTPSTPTPIEIEYRHSERLGVDRIAAAVGAHAEFPQEWLLVVDAGTAVTYDVVTPEGKFIGGNIAPGIDMRLRSLHSYTARLPELHTPEEPATESGKFGHSTAEAMINGAVYGVAAEIEYYRNALPETARVVLTGGSAHTVGRLASYPVTIDDNLVTNGLNNILRYNEINVDK